MPRAARPPDRDYAIAGDLRPVPILGRESVAAMQAAPDAAAMLALHARQVRSVSGRAASLFWVVEQAASAHLGIAGLWAQMTDNRRTGARWAAATLLTKPGLASRVGQDYAEEVFWVAIEPGTYRSLTLGRGLSPAGFESWVRNFYEKMLLAQSDQPLTSVTGAGPIRPNEPGYPHSRT